MPGAGIRESIKYYAKELKLPTFASPDRLLKDFAAGQNPEEFMLALMKEEYEHRKENQRRRRVKKAGFPMVKTIEEFDLKALSHVKPEYVRQLVGGDFIDRHENIVMIGNPGTGKTHLMTAIGYRACLNGRRVLFRNATTLATELKEAKDSYQLRKMEKAVAATDLLLLDELSYTSFSQEASELLFKIIAERSERSSTIITTNLEFSRWVEMFSNQTLVAALVDRLTFHSHILNMNGKSYRLKSSGGKENA